MLRLIFSVIIIISLQTSFAYDEAQEHELYYFTSASYCRPSKIENWSCGKACRGSPQLSDIMIFHNSTGANSGLGGYNSARNEITLVFRGTVPWLMQNWIEDIDFLKMNYPYCDNGCQVHRGFFFAFKEVRDQMVAHLVNLRQKYPTATLTVTGHSLGGAMATHALVHLIKLGYVINHFSTQGCPRVGDEPFTKFFNALYKGTSFRLVHSHDPVPHLPLTDMGFKHVPNEIYYKKSTQYQICDDALEEDNNCSKGNILDLNVFHHMHYLDLDLLIEVPLCQ